MICVLVLHEILILLLEFIFRMNDKVLSAYQNILNSSYVSVFSQSQNTVKITMPFIIQHLQNHF